MSERGIRCDRSCGAKEHGECHSNCPRLDEANNLVHQLVKLVKEVMPGLPSIRCNPRITKLLEKAEDFWKMDESFHPEEEIRRQQQRNLLLFIDPSKCSHDTTGTVPCPKFVRVGDDYGNCRMTGKDCPCGGCVYPRKITLRPLDPNLPLYKALAEDMQGVFGFNDADMLTPDTEIPDDLPIRRELAIRLYEHGKAKLEMINDCPYWKTIADVIASFHEFTTISKKGL